MSAPSFKILLGWVTPGPWGYDLNHTVGRHEDGEWADSVVQLPVGTHKRRPTLQEKSDAQFIARCNPETMLLVYEALEKCDHIIKTITQDGRSHIVIERALKILDASPTPPSAPHEEG